MIKKWLKPLIKKNKKLYIFINLIKVYILFLLDLVLLPIFFLTYLITNKNYSRAGQSLINSYCITGGYSNDFLSFILSIFNPPKALDLLCLDDHFKLRDNVNEIVDALNINGFYVFKDKLPISFVDELHKFSLLTPSVLRPMDGDAGAILSECIYAPDKKRAICYDFKQKDLINFAPVQQIISNPLFIRIAQKYLNVEPYLDGISMWWQTDFNAEPDKSAAQYFHFDMDRIKWLKFFIYLTDVDRGGGPHTFVAGTHKSGAVPQRILGKGYERLEDIEILNSFNPANVKAFLGGRGTIIVEDTRGLHKGQNVTSKDRLLLQLQFSNSLFGSNGSHYNKNNFNQIKVNDLKLLINSNPGIYKCFL